MKRLTITNTHGWTVNSLRKKERMLKDGFLRQRVMAVRLVMEGYLGKEVAAMLTLHRQSVAKYVAKFNEGGLSELLKREVPSGREPYLSSKQQAELKRVILESTPSQEGMGVYASWDSRILQQFIFEKWGISMSRGGIIHMLHRLRLSYTRPTYTMVKADKEKQEAFTQQLDMIKKNSLQMT
ncbi:helix-turn-helix domain-containing protein [Aneurinibacillus danicus]|jgi:transposase|uniref:Winged helix-turn helix domain-containing protein n=1 Tax=Aneurinibacillus danicus TaxID=267746 RepID=A0A511VC18_9BACL|nr:winged helix-turn-helix domain-containing protein [Aneurinibacillus danicus]GEN36379.1 hypothetical protein ADA01nite_38390 [Aneurinibacillus danicus]